MNKDYFWALITVIIAITLALIFLMVVRDDQSEGEALATSPYDKHLLEVDKEALEDAYRAQIVHVYEVWMRDYHLGVTHRAATGFSNARKAYIEAQGRLKEREQQQ